MARKHFRTNEHYIAELNEKTSGSIDDVIVGRRAICHGTFNDKTQLVATRVDVRTK